MKPAEVRAAIARLAANQWGLVTTAQATAAGATRMLLTRMADSGELERVVYGVYAVPAALADAHLEKRALWLALDPTKTAQERLAHRHEAGVLSHATAAALHGIGDILDDRVEITMPHRQQSRREGLRLYRAELRPDETTYAEGLPVTTASRTLADLVAAGHDRDHIATALDDAIHQDLTTPEQVQAALEERLGPPKGSRVFAELLVAAGLDEASLERSVVNSSIGHRAIGNALQVYLKAWSESSPSIDTKALGGALAAALPSTLSKLDVPEMVRNATALTAPASQLLVSDAVKQTASDARLRDALLRFSTMYAHDDAPVASPAVQRAMQLASGHSTTEPRASIPDESPLEEEEDQAR